MMVSYLCATFVKHASIILGFSTFYAIQDNDFVNRITLLYEKLPLESNDKVLMDISFQGIRKS
jgi:hypothetical protein